MAITKQVQSRRCTSGEGTPSGACNERVLRTDDPKTKREVFLCPTCDEQTISLIASRDS